VVAIEVAVFVAITVFVAVAFLVYYLENLKKNQIISGG
jgi:hypothetical protein